MPKSPIAYIDLSFFAHATEDPDKVMKAVQNVVSTDIAEKISFKKSKLKGDHGNLIIFYKTRIDEEKITEPLLHQISSQLSAQDKQMLLEELDRHIEKGSLYMRLDKQSAFKGNLGLCLADPIHIRIRFKKGKNEDIIKICTDAKLLPEPCKP